MRRTVFAVVVAAALGAVAPSAIAQPHYSAAFEPCMERSGGVTASMIECIGDEFTLQDRRLNALYKEALKTLPATRRGALTHAQRAWLAFKNAECEFVFDPDGGSAARISANDCALRMTAERADALDAVLQSARGI